MPARRVLRGHQTNMVGDIKSGNRHSIVAVCMLCSYAHVDFSVIVASEAGAIAVSLIPTYLTWVKLAAQPLKVDPHSLCDY